MKPYSRDQIRLFDDIWYGDRSLDGWTEAEIAELGPRSIDGWTEAEIAELFGPPDIVADDHVTWDFHPDVWEGSIVRYTNGEVIISADRE